MRRGTVHVKIAGGVAALVLWACGGTTPSTCPQALCNGVCCGDAGQCIANACCPSAQVCDSACCNPGVPCVASASGGHVCGMLCQRGGECPAATPCCTSVDGGPEGICQVGSDSCLCLTGADCASGACIPEVTGSGLISGPYVCGANDGTSHQGCADAGTCQLSNQSCSHDLLGNQFCTVPCSSDLNCANTGVACCNAVCAQGHCCGLCGH
jgi:hypothetical protein